MSDPARDEPGAGGAPRQGHAAPDRGRLCSTPLRELKLTIAGTRLAPVIEEFRRELERAGIVRLRPDFYLSTEWGVNDGTIGIAIPFYLADAELTAIQRERLGYVEGEERSDLLRYLRHEMGHVVNYAYLLHQRPDWRAAFGAMELPYEEEFHVDPFSHRFVLNLPGWYAQKHPDEDWSETFAVWMTPDFDWRSAYAGWPEALAKLECCDRIMAEVNGRDPLVTAAERDEDVDEAAQTIDQLYGDGDPDEALPAGVVVLLRTLLRGESGSGSGSGGGDEGTARPAAALIRRRESALVEAVHRWTGRGPEAVRGLLRGLAAHADSAGLGYAAEREAQVTIELTALVAALSMNEALRGGAPG